MIIDLFSFIRAMATKRTYTIAFKGEVVTFINAPHDMFRDAWINTGPREINPEELEVVGQEDDIDVIDDDLNNLVLDGDEEE